MTNKNKFRAKIKYGPNENSWMYAEIGKSSFGQSMSDIYFNNTEVKLDTLGQFTDRIDKNGKEIYEGDIVENGLSGTWIIEPLERGSMSLKGICKKYRDCNYDISALNSNVKIIGNIYENPELWIP